nr:MAG: RNA-dependent RNA polymerase [Rhizoctonia solani narnavirus 16]
MKDKIKILQYCKLKRSLPKPSPANARNDCNEWVTDMTLPHRPRPVPHTLQVQLKKVPRVIESSGDLKPTPGDFISSAGAIGYDRKSGGRTRFLVDQHLGAVELNSAMQALKTGFIVYPRRGLSFKKGRGEFNKEKRLVSLTPALERLFHTGLPINDMQPLPVREFGCKTRIVTKSQPLVVAKAHSARRRLWPLLTNERHIVTSEALRDPDLNIIDFGFAPVGLIVFSGDFTRATDELTHEVLDLVCDVTGCPPDLVHRNIQINGAPMTKGTPMGMPPGWALLSVVHNAICEVVDRARRYRIKGDDIIALWSREQISRYTELCLSVGLVVNDKSTTSMTHGTFCEGDYELVRGGPSGNSARLVRLPTFSLRSAASLSLPTQTEWLTLQGRNVPLARYRRYIVSVWRHVIDYAWARGVSPWMPTQLGGLGMPCVYPDARLRAVDRKILRSACNLGKITNLPKEYKSGSVALGTARLIDDVRWALPANIPEALRDRCDAALEAFNELSQDSMSDAAWYDVQAGNNHPETPVRSWKDIVRQQRRFLNRRTKELRSEPPAGGQLTIGQAWEVVGRLRPYPPDIAATWKRWPAAKPFFADTSAWRWTVRSWDKDRSEPRERN